MKVKRETGAVGASRSRRKIYLRDSLVMLVLCLVTVALFGVTLFLFKSFERHRADLGQRWGGRGRLALAQGRPEEAAAALRTALSYAPDNFDDQLLLAQALAAAGHEEAANNYFLNLWEVHPGDGFLNLQLARLARKRGNEGEAINYYRASIFGNWEQHGVERRREVRLELADYLVERGQGPAAQAELLIAAGNAPEKDVPLQLEIADRLQRLGDLPDALRFYKVAAAQEPHNLGAVASEGRAEFAGGDYAAASRSLAAAAELARRVKGHEADAAALGQQAAEARRLPELGLSRELPAGERAAHLVLDAGIAQSRLRVCTAQLEPKPVKAGAGAVLTVPPAAPEVAATLGELHGRWIAQGHVLKAGTLERNPAQEDTLTQLIGDTEGRLAPVCGVPTGDDALLLLATRQLAAQAVAGAGMATGMGVAKGTGVAKVVATVVATGVAKGAGTGVVTGAGVARAGVGIGGKQ